MGRIRPLVLTFDTPELKEAGLTWKLVCHHELPYVGHHHQNSASFTLLACILKRWYSHFWSQQSYFVLLGYMLGLSVTYPAKPTSCQVGGYLVTSKCSSRRAIYFGGKLRRLEELQQHTCHCWQMLWGNCQITWQTNLSRVCTFPD